MNRLTEYKRLRRIGWRASEAYRAGTIEERFQALDAGYDDRGNDLDELGLVRLKLMEDDRPGSVADFLDEDAYSAGMIKAEQERMERDGLWGIVGQCRIKPSGEWIDVDSVWGFIGDDWKDSGYDTDVKGATLCALKDALFDEGQREAQLELVKLFLDEDEPFDANLSDATQDAIGACYAAAKLYWKTSALSEADDWWEDLMDRLTLEQKRWLGEEGGDDV